MDAKVWTFALLFPSAVFLFGFYLWAMFKALTGMGQLAKEAGWKKVGWGIYLAGPWGGPYAEPDTKASQPRARRHPVRRALLLLAFVFMTEVLALIGGAAVADASGRSPLAGAIVGLLGYSMLIGAVWVAVGGRALRSEIANRPPAS